MKAPQNRSIITSGSPLEFSLGGCFQYYVCLRSRRPQVRVLPGAPTFPGTPIEINGVLHLIFLGNPLRRPDCAPKSPQLRFILPTSLPVWRNNA